MARTNNRMIRGKTVIFLQFAFIVVLVYALSSEYHSNVNQQKWISENVPWLQYLLNGYVIAALIGILIGAAFLLLADVLRTRNAGRGGLKTVV